MNSAASLDQDMARRLFDAHDTYKENFFTHRRFKHRDMVPLLDALGNQHPFVVSQIGESLEKRAIYQVEAGTGQKKVLLWSQMHGDEATATMALFDLFNFLKAKDDGFDEWRQTILANTSLYAVPMLNPDGAERFQRRTATDIDMNRDALRLQTPEGTLLKSLQQTLRPLVGFNLHDQNPRYTVGRTGKQAVMSFLATAYDEERTVNEVRERSMKLIVAMNRALQQFIPGQVGRFDDEFEPRAFGENIQKWGTTLILIESGGYKGDTEKMAIRRLNFVAMLVALQAIATESYQQEETTPYQAIPENGRLLYDVLLRNVTVMHDGRPVRVDIGINQNEVNINEATSFRYKSVIDDIGDLSTFYGLEEIDATGLTLEPAREYDTTLASVNDLDRIDWMALQRKGILVFRVREKPQTDFPDQPVHILYEGDFPARPLQIDQTPTFLLTREGQLVYSFVNGFYNQPTDQTGKRANGVAE